MNGRAWVVEVPIMWFVGGSDRWTKAQQVMQW
jgi:hypothetical protein